MRISSGWGKCWNEGVEGEIIRIIDYGDYPAMAVIKADITEQVGVDRLRKLEGAAGRPSHVPIKMLEDVHPKHPQPEICPACKTLGRC